MKMRPNKHKYYIEIAKAVACRSTCSRRKFGVVIVKNDTILSTGYNGSARGVVNCGEEIPCLKDLYNEPSNKTYENCPAVHGEMNAIINSARSGTSIYGATMFIAQIGGSRRDKGARPCFLCRRMMINAGIKDCFYEGITAKLICENVSEWVKEENELLKKKVKNNANS